MYAELNLLQLVKLLGKLIAHKYQQYKFSTNEYEIVCTACGKIKGIKRRPLYNEDDCYYAFEGIPFAKPPLGKLRFRAPQPPDPWQGVLDCTTYKPMPMQRHFVRKLTEGSEDCLYLNVYAKNLHSQKPLPVMVFIYGGGYQFGEASRDLYAPDYFMQRDVVLVEISYRLGVFGFLSLNDPDLDVPGNAGLKDQVMALRWVRDNIAKFNGDPNNITLFGESAGGASTHYLMLTPRTKGLFHKAILQSGVAFCPWTNTPQRDWPYRLACHIGYKGNNNDQDIYNYLMRQSARRLTTHMAALLTAQDMVDNILFPFCPVVEPFDSEDCVISKPIIDSLSSAWSNEIPIIIGGNSFEGLFYYSLVKKYPLVVDELTDCVNLLPSDTGRSQEELKHLAHKLKLKYFGDKVPSAKHTFNEFLNLTTYKLFWHSFHRVIRARQAYAPNAPTFCYVFDFDSAFFNHYRYLTCGPSVRGVDHADDLSYLFYNISAQKLNRATAEYQCIQRMVGMWCNFALSSNPNCKEIAPTKWEPIESEVGGNEPIKCLNISEEVEFKNLPMHDDICFWDSLYAKGALY